MKKYHSLVLAAALSTIGLGAMVVAGDKKVGIDPPQTELKLTEQSAQTQTLPAKAPVAKATVPDGMVAVKTWPDVVLNAADEEQGCAVYSMTIEVKRPGSVLSFDWKVIAANYSSNQVIINNDYVGHRGGYGLRAGSFSYTFEEAGTYTLQAFYYN